MHRDREEPDDTKISDFRKAVRIIKAVGIGAVLGVSFAIAAGALMDERKEEKPPENDNTPEVTQPKVD